MMDITPRQREYGNARHPVTGGRGQADGLVDLSVLVSTPEGAEPEQRRLTTAIRRVNAQATWRYLSRFVAHADPSPEHIVTSTALTSPRAATVAEARRFDIILARVQGEPPPVLAGLSHEDIERWQVDGPWLVIVEDLHPTPAVDAETMRRRNALRGLIDWAETQPRVLVAHRAPHDDLATLVLHLLSDVARRIWTARNGVDRVVCRRCGHQIAVDRRVGLCPNDGSVMVRPAVLDKRRVPPWIGDFPIHGVVGRGAFGKVWLSMSAGREWGALKTLLDTDNAHALARLHRELRLLEHFDHPHIVRLLEKGEVDGSPVGLLEYLPGRPLKFVLDALPPRLVLDLMLDLLSALTVIHQQGIVHRDLKPGNIMLVDDPQRPADPPRLVLLDFGLGKHARHIQEELTKQGMVLGTPNYMAPEQFVSAATADARSDLYAIGVMLYMALTPDKRYPIDPPANMNDIVAFVDFIERVKTDTPRPIERQGIPSGICQVVMKALERRPEDRFASAHEMRVALARELERWDELTIEDPPDLSWMTWSPSAAYVAYHAQARSSASGNVTISSESLPITYDSLPAVSTTGEPMVFAGPPTEPPVGPVSPTEPPTSFDPPPTGQPVTEADHPVAPHTAPERFPWHRLVVLLLSLAIAGAAFVSLRPTPTFADVRVTRPDGSPIEGVEVFVGGEGAAGSTGRDGTLRVPLGLRSDGPWTVEVRPPPGLRVRGGGARELDAAAFEGEFARAVFEVYNPFSIRNPGGSLVPVSLAADHVVLLRDVRLGALFPADRAGLIHLARGTELHTCQDTPLIVEGAPPPPPETLRTALEDCIAAPTADGLVVLGVRRPGAERSEIRAHVVE